MPQPYAQTLRAFAADRPQRAWLAWSLCGIFGAAWFAWFFGAVVPVYAVSEHARLEVAEAPSGVDAAITGQVMSSALVLGATVKAGDILVTLDPSRAQLMLAEEEERMRSARAKIAALRAEIASRRKAQVDDAAARAAALDAARARQEEADAALAFASDTAERVTGLAARGVVARVDAQKAVAERKRLAAAAAALSADRLRLDGEARAGSNAGQAEIDRLDLEATALAGDYTAAQAAASRLSLEVERHVLRAPASGRIADVVSLHGGSHVSEGQRLAVIVPAGEVQVIADFAPSPSLGRVSPGQRAELRLDGFPWAQYGVLGAVVSRVDSEVRNGFVRVELRLDAATGNAIVQHGLPGSVAVRIEQVTPAVLLLRAAGVMISGSSRRAASPQGAAS